jgi:hypothetical protein
MVESRQELDKFSLVFDDCSPNLYGAGLISPSSKLISLMSIKTPRMVFIAIKIDYTCL